MTTNDRPEGTIFSYSAEDALAALRAAPNVNSAIKNFLKRQVQQDPQGARFVKDLKTILSSPRDEPALAFIEKHLSRFSPHLLAVGAYAFNEVVEKVSSGVVQNYADKFNETYQHSDQVADGVEASNIKVTNEADFSKIMKEAVAMVESNLREQDQESPFLRAILLNAIFEPPVLEAGYDRGLV